MKKILPFIILILFIVGVIIILFGFTGCKHYQSKPKIIEGEPMPCYDFRDCMYRNKNNTDKSICLPFAQECRAFRRFNKVKNDRPENMDFNQAWLFLNQK